jgi:trk system potassium uptake protein TrkH
MHLLPILRILGVLLMAFSLSMLPPMGVSWFYGAELYDSPADPAFWLKGDGAAYAFLIAFAGTLLVGAVCWYPARGGRRKAAKDLKIRDGFVVVAGFWFVLGMAGSAPLYTSGVMAMTFTDAVFESISGLTTTGATVITGLDALPRSLLYYRQQLQWFGGMGIIVLAVAVLPMLGIGGMQLYRAETPGPIKDTKLTPRITETAKALWIIYATITVACCLSYLACGMELFDAIGHAFSTVAIGGFSTHDASIGYFRSDAVDLVAIVFMLIAGANFSLHFIAWRRLTSGLPFRIQGGRIVRRERGKRSWSPHGAFRGYAEDPEFRAYLVGLFILSLIVIGFLYFDGAYDGIYLAVMRGLFQVVSIGTTTGFTTADFSAWHGAVPVLLLFWSFIGGCAGSTGGGMKVIRWLLIYKQGNRELLRLLHPSAEIPVKLGKRPVPHRVIDAVWGFFSAYVIVFGVMMTILMFAGLDQITAFSAIAASLNNLGPGLGQVAANYASINDVSKWVCVLAMLLGRLEIFTLLVLITPDFWRK